MKKVFQKIISDKNGDCLKCAVASLLDLNYADVPHFTESNKWFPLFYGFLQERKLKWRGYLHNGENNHEILERFFVGSLPKYEGIDGYFIASVYSPKYGTNTTHAVVIDKNWNIVHDPNPENHSNIIYPKADVLGYNGILNISLIER